MPRPSRATPRVSGALLVLCYLEVVLWTACLLSVVSGAARAETLAGHGYLQRETCNLKCFASSGIKAPLPLFKEVHIAADLAAEWEHAAAARQLTALAARPGSAHQGAELEQLRALLLEQSALQAPFTGIAAID